MNVYLSYHKGLMVTIPRYVNMGQNFESA